MKDNSNVDIFVFVHKAFETNRTNPVYKIVASSDCDVTSDKLEVIKLDCELSNIGFSEWQKIYELWKKGNLKDYVGIAHYHRYLSFGPDVNYLPDIDELFEKCDIVTKELTMVGNLRSNYANCHNINDYNLVMQILVEKYPEMLLAASQAEQAGIIVDSNIMILKKDDFNKLCEFVFGVLFEYCDRVGIDKTSDESFVSYMKAHIEGYMKKHLPDDNEYLQQARICSFLAERLVAMWIFANIDMSRWCAAKLIEQ